MELNEIIAKNLIAYRKQMQLTQAELAEKINYSDKSISKWERAEGIPDITILKQLADFYGITVNDFLNESGNIKTVKIKRQFLRKRIIIMLLSVGLVWVVATLFFTALNLFKNPVTNYAWLCFIYALPISGIVLTVFSSVWKQRILNFFSISLIFWTFTLSLYLSIPALNSWLLFLIPTALQIMLVFWFFLRHELNRLFKKANPRSKKTKTKIEQKNAE